ncbi:ABC transporter substrate-binding protein [Aestuariivirga sp.]|uniref:ABC transporter substrate-binding protein n=1 Tax=Aestuariivirga sp. TaxID=2650926 RepID=UPI0025B8CBAC|nr:ABC transporter substrate-binding protein [Aestuariivirga sp.]MCA3554560.1 ABC transporter substrate-binding protein [Aestuariivirga sp.]
MKIRILLGAALLASSMLAANAAEAAKTLVYCSEGSPENFTPAINTTGTSFDAARPVYNRLVQFTPGTTEVEPALAESWTVSPDGLTITFKLRPGVKFHSGVNGFTPTRDLTAEDVIWSFDRQSKPDHPYAKISGGSFDYFNDMGMPDLLESITKGDDDLTVIFKLKKPNAPIIANLAMDFAAIQSAEYARYLLDKGTPEQFDQIPVGTGSFEFVAYQKDAVIRFKAFDGWAGKPKIDNLVYAITPDATARYAKLKANECQVMIAPNPADLPEIKKNPDVKVLEQAGLNIGYYAMNNLKPPFDNREVRKAFAMAVDRDAILKEVYQGAGQKATNLIPPTMWSYDESIEGVEYNPEKAKKMLADAGVKDLKIDIWWMPVQRPYNPNAKRMAEMIQADLARIGVESTLVSYEWGEYRKRMQAGEHMTGMLGWTGDNGDPDNFFGVLLGCNSEGKPNSNNIPKWCNAKFQDVVNRAVQITDQNERAKLYKEAQKIQAEEMPQLNIAHSTVYEPIRTNVKGYKVSPLGAHEFQNVELE